MNNKQRIITLASFLLGIFMGAIDSGIVSPARTVINNSFNVDPSLGIWMITIYTLAYAVSMPISSKLSDRLGRKKMYIISIVIFASGSAFCGLTNFFGSFPLFLTARIIQAIGGGGIVPIATAFIGQSFPAEKRGSALGFVGAIYGIATILGPTLGSGVLGIAGNQHWGWVFFINIPVSILILFLTSTMEESKGSNNKKMDLLGSFVLSIIILSLMYSLTNLNFFDFSNSIRATNVWPFLLTAIIFVPIFIFIERKALDPIINLKYFKNKDISLTFLLSFIVGVGLMGVVFVPQFAENTLKIKSGSGGYLVTLMAIFAGIGAPLGGKLIDKYSPKLVISIGFLSTIMGTLFLALYTTKHPNFISVLIGLIFVGLGMGFTMGTPLNYLILSHVDKNESASGLSTLSLIRSIGVTISPNIMINFIAEAGKNIPIKIQAALPKLNMPYIPGMPSNIPGMPTNISMTSMGKGAVSSSALESLKSADVTTIVNTIKNFMSHIIDKIIPQIKTILEGMLKSAPKKPGMPDLSNYDFTLLLNNWKTSYIQSIESKRAYIEGIFQSTLNNGFRNMFIAAAIIALTGLFFTQFISVKEK